jgi:pyruvate kinase
VRKTKIIATLGPSCGEEKTLRTMIEAGMNGARFNFSHGSYSEHLKRLNALRRASAASKAFIALIQDLPGPKIRVGNLSSPVIVRKGDTITVTAGHPDLSLPSIDTTYPQMVSELRVGDAIFIDDGTIELRVEKKRDNELVCRVIEGGKIVSRKGINLPSAPVTVGAFTEEDAKHLEWGIEHGFDYAALSFVREPEEVCRARAIAKKKKSNIRLIAKIEKPEALSRIDEIIEVSDSIMVARGDLGIEMGAETVPETQKNIIRKCIERDKLVITATQMLQSMISSPRPTRAEASDVANAVMDGTDCVMLSGETAVGQYPAEAVSVMSRIIIEAENYILQNEHAMHTHLFSESPISDALCHGAYQTACDIGAKVIGVFTISGATALLMSKYHPPVTVVGVTTREESLRGMALYRNVYPVRVPKCRYFEDMLRLAEKVILKAGVAKAGDLAVFTAGTPIGTSGTTNSLHIRRLGVTLN